MEARDDGRRNSRSNRLLSTLCIVCLALSIFQMDAAANPGPPQIIEGTIFYSDGSTPIYSATVWVNDTTAGTSYGPVDTGLDGIYRLTIPRAPGNSIKTTVWKIGIMASSTVVSADEPILQINVTMGIAPPTIDDIAICYDTFGIVKIVNGTIPYNAQYHGYSCAFNDTLGFFNIASGTWTVENYIATSTGWNGTGVDDWYNSTSTIDPGAISWWNLTIGPHAYSVRFTSPSVDWISITHANGTIVDASSMEVGQTLNLYASAYNSTLPGDHRMDGFAPANWTIENTDGSNGSISLENNSVWTQVYTGATPGTINIDAKYEGNTDDSKVSVSKGPLHHIEILLEGGVYLQENDTYNTDQTVQFSVRGYDIFNNYLGYRDSNWTLEGGGALSNSSGTHTVADWSVVESANLTANYSGFVDRHELQITPGTVEHIVISPNNQTNMTADEELDFNATAYDADWNVVPNVLFSWSTNDTRSSIDSNGVFNASTNGIWGITASFWTVSSTVEVNVSSGALYRIMISPENTSITTDDSVQYTAIGYDSDNNSVSGFTLSWTEDDPAGTVDANGTYEPGTVGEWSINASSGNISGTSNVTVSPGTLARIAILIPPAEGITADDTFQFSAICFDDEWNIIPGVEFSWRTEYHGGSINSAGLYTPVEVGEWTITVYNGTVEDSTTIMVAPGIIDSVWLIEDRVQITAGEPYTFHALAYDAHNNPVTDAVFSWSTNALLATMDNSTCTPAITGTWTITAAAGGQQDTSEFYTTPADIHSITVTAMGTTANSGGVQYFQARANDQYNNPVPYYNYTWSTDDPMAMIYGGVLHAYSIGDVNVTASIGSLSDTTNITVVPGSVRSIEVNRVDAEELFPGDEARLFARAYDAQGNVVQNVTLTWSTNTHGTVANNIFSATSGGKYTIVVTADGVFDTLVIDVLSEEITPVEKGIGDYAWVLLID